MQLEAFVAAQHGIMEDDVGWGGFLTFEVRIQRYIAIQTSWCGASLDSHIFRATRMDGAIPRTYPRGSSFKYASLEGVRCLRQRSISASRSQASIAAIIAR
jgi:hypothetical protein